MPGMSVARIGGMKRVKIVCAGINYRAHAEEMGHTIPDEPVIFLKPPTAVLAPGGEIRIPRGLDVVEAEAQPVTSSDHNPVVATLRLPAAGRER